MLFSNVDGEFLDQELNSISFSDVENHQGIEIIVVFKPNRHIWRYWRASQMPGRTSQSLKWKKNCCSKKIIQHPFFNEFNPLA